MEIDITCGSITVRLGGVESYTADGTGATVHPDNPSGVQIISYTYSVPGTAYQAKNPIPVNDNVAITSTVATGTFLQELDSLVVLFTRTTRPSPTPYSAIDEAMAIVVVPYGGLVSNGSAQLIRPPAIGSPTNPSIATLRATPLIFDNATIDAIPHVVDIDNLPTTWGAFGNARPNIDTYLDRWVGFCGELWKGWGTASWTPSQQHPGYGAAMSALTSESLLLVVSQDDGEKRRELARRMTQWGVDLLGAFLSGRDDKCDGGHMQGRKALVVLSGYLLQMPWENPTPLFPGQFNEDEQFYTASPAWPWGWPYGYRGHSDYAWNLSSPISSWNTAVLYYLPRYFGQEVMGTQIGCAVAMRILGLTDEMGVGHYGMVSQWMEGPSASDLAAMAAVSTSPPLSGILWGTSYSIGGGPQDFGRAAWEAYGDYVPPAGPDPAPRIVVSGNGQEIVDGDDTPEAVDHTAFGVAVAGGSTISRTFTVENTGDGDMTVANVSVPVGFTITTALPSTIETGTSDPLVIRLDADVPGTKAGVVSITTNTPGTPKFTFGISGTVTAAAPSTPPPGTVVGQSVLLIAANARIR